MTRALLLAAALLMPALAAAQPRPAPGPGPASPERDGGWTTFGVGPSAPYHVAAAVTANFGRERFVQVGAQSNWLLTFSGPGVYVNTLHVGPGVSRVGRWDRVALAAGPAVVWGRDPYPDGNAPYVTGGLVGSAQIAFTPLKEVGLGLHLFAHLNPVRTGAGAAVSLVFEGNK